MLRSFYRQICAQRLLNHLPRAFPSIFPTSMPRRLAHYTLTPKLVQNRNLLQLRRPKIHVTPPSAVFTMAMRQSSLNPLRAYLFAFIELRRFSLATPPADRVREPFFVGGATSEQHGRCAAQRPQPPGTAETHRVAQAYAGAGLCRPALNGKLEQILRFVVSPPSPLHVPTFQLPLASRAGTRAGAPAFLARLYRPSELRTMRHILEGSVRRLGSSFGFGRPHSPR